MILEKVYRKQVLPLLEQGPMSIAMKVPCSIRPSIRSSARS